MAFVSVGSGGGDTYSMPTRAASSRERRQSLVALRRHSEAVIAAAQQQRKSISSQRGVYSEDDPDIGRRSVHLENINEFPLRKESTVSSKSGSIPRMSLSTVLENNPQVVDEVFPWANSGDKKFDMLKAEYLELLEDLVGAEPEKRNWKGIALALLTICFVFFLVFIAVLVLTPDPIKTGSVDITLDHIADASLRPKQIPVQWLSESEVAVQNANGDIEIYKGLDDLSSLDANFTRQTLVTEDDISQYGHSGSQIEWSFSPDPDNRFILIKSPAKPTSKSHTAIFKNCEILDKHAQSSKGKISGQYKACRWMLSSDEKLHVALVDDKNNVRMMTDVDAGTVSPPVHDEADSDNFYGYPDLFYQEAVWKSALPALWMSADQKNLVFASFNDSQVIKSEVVDYSTGSAVISKVNFPKRGEPIPDVKLHWIAAGASQSQEITHDDFAGKYLLCLQWITASKLKSDWLDRSQTNKYTYIHGLDLNAKTYTTKKLPKESVSPIGSSAKANSDVDSPNILIDGQCSLIEEQPPFDIIYDIVTRQSTSGSFMHLVRKTAGDNGIGHFMTAGSYDVAKIIGVTISHVYILAPSSSSNLASRHVFAVDKNSKTKKCVTCSFEETEQCSYFDAEVSPHKKWINLRCLGPDVPKTLLVKLDLDSEERRVIKLTAGEELLQKLTKLKLAQKHHMQFENIHLLLIRPSIVDNNHKYPLVVYLDSDPSQQSVVSKWDFSYLDYISSTNKIFVAVIDTRGSRGYGVHFMQEVNEGARPGEVESDDIATVLEQLQREEVIDPYRIAILSMEYGAYIAGELVNNNQDLVRCAAMLRPVSNISSFNAFFAEQKIPLGSHSVSTFDANLEHFDGVNPLIIASLTDKTVLYEQTAQLVNKFSEETIPFRTQVYTALEASTDEVLRHGHVIYELTTYLTRCLRVPMHM